MATYKALANFTALRKEPVRIGEIITSKDLGSFESYFLSNGSIIATDEAIEVTPAKTEVKADVKKEDEDLDQVIEAIDEIKPIKSTKSKK